jgi:hypothetical protein
LPSSKLIYFSQVDKECHFPDGTTKRHTDYIKNAAHELGCEVEGEEGGDTILFKSRSRTGV